MEPVSGRFFPRSAAGVAPVGLRPRQPLRPPSETELRAWLSSKKSDLLSAIVAKKDIKADGIEYKIKAALDEFSATFA